MRYGSAFALSAENAAVMGPVRHLMPGAMGSFRKRRQNSVTSLPELLGFRVAAWPVPHQRPPRSRSDRLEPLRSSARAPPRWPRQARPQQPGRRSSVISWGAPLLPARGTVARRNGFMRCRGGRVFGRPSGRQDRTQQAKLEIPFGHAFDKRGASLPKSAVRVRPVGLGREAHRVTAAALEAHRQHVRNAWR